MINKHTGTSMGGSIEYTRNVKSIPCNCSKCHHRRKDSKSNKYYCDYYKILEPKKKKCARYYDATVKGNKKGNKKSTSKKRLCNMCIHYKKNNYLCTNFNFRVSSTSVGAMCKAFKTK